MREAWHQAIPTNSQTVGAIQVRMAIARATAARTILMMGRTMVVSCENKSNNEILEQLTPAFPNGDCHALIG